MGRRQLDSLLERHAAVSRAALFVLGLRPPTTLEMAGGKTFHFAADGIHAALAPARHAAAGEDVRLGGGVSRLTQS